MAAAPVFRLRAPPRVQKPTFSAESRRMSIFDYVVLAGFVAAVLAALTWGVGPRWPLALLCAPLWWLFGLVLAAERPQWDGARSASILWNVALVLLAIGGVGQLLERL